MSNSPRNDPRGVPSGISRDEQMGSTQTNAAFTAPVDVTSASTVIDRVGLQRLLTQLQTCAPEYGLKERHLSVLAMLASFVQQMTADGRPVVFASNRTMSARAHNMDIQRLQRAFRDLIRDGWILRQSSPNGKRYAHRNLGGQITDAYGIDLSPLIQRAAEIDETCRIVTERQLRIRLLRDRLSNLRRAFPETAQEQVQIRTLLRRRSESAQSLQDALAELDRRASDLADQSLTAQVVQFSGGSPSLAGEAAIDAKDIAEKQSVADDFDCLNSTPHNPEQISPCRTLLGRATGQASKTTFLIPNDCQIDTHYQSQKQNIFERSHSCKHSSHTHDVKPRPSDDIQPRDLVEACPDAMSFVTEKPETWDQLQRLAWTLAPMIGISPPLASRALQKFGVAGFAISVLGLVQRFSSQGRNRIHVPAAYLTSILSDSRRAFSPSQFIRTLVPSAEILG